MPSVEHATPSTQTDLSIARNLLRHLWRGGHYGYHWANPGKESYWMAITDPLPELTGRKNYHFGLHPTLEKPADPRYHRSTRRTVCAVNTLFGEFDAKDFGGDLRAALAHIHHLPLPPSVIICSGGGYHCYWLLRDTFHIQTDAQRAYIDQLQKRWVTLIGSDPGAKDLTRMLRLPGTRNYKPQYGPGGAAVTTVHANFDQLYALADFDLLLPPEIKRRPISRPYTRPQTQPGQDQARQWAARYADEKISALLAVGQGERNRKLYETAFVLGQLVHTGLLAADDVQNWLTAAGQSIGLDPREIAATVTSGLNAGLTVSPNWIPNFDTAAPAKRRRLQKVEDTVQPVHLPTLTAHQTVALPYISALPPRDILARHAVAVKSALGTGKTELIKRLIDDLGPDAHILGITHRNALIANLGERLNLDTHRTIPAHRLSQAHRLITTPNSLHKVNETRQWDLVFIDEIEQVLPHLLGGTFHGGESYRAHQVITTILRNARRVIILDAHLTTISAQWLHERTGAAPYILKNSYQPDRGNLTLYKHEDAVIADAIRAIEEQRGPVIIPVSSKTRARVIHRLLVRRFGAAHNLLVTGDNSTNRDIQAFIRDINHPARGIAALRFLVCTSSFGTGLDVTAPVYGVFGVFHNRPLLASDMLQMLMRYRNAAQRAAYVQPYHARDPRPPEDMVQDHIAAAETTATAADFDRHGIQTTTQEHHSLQRLEARLTVSGALQQTDLVSYFAAFAEAEGFTLVYNNKRHMRTRQTLATIQEQLAEETAQRVIAASPVDAEQFKQHQLTGTMTEAIIAGHERWKIEQSVGLDITRPIYDDLHTPRARSALRRLTDLITPVDDLKGRDRAEATEQVLLSQRGHYTTTSALVMDGLTRVFGTDPITSRRDFTVTQLDDCGFVAWLRDHLPAIQRLVDQRPDLSENPLYVLRRLLKTIGLKLSGQRVMVNGARFWLYTLDPAQRDRWLAYAHARRTALTTNAEKTPPLRVRGKWPDFTPNSAVLDLDVLENLGALYRGERYPPPR